MGLNYFTGTDTIENNAVDTFFSQNQVLTISPNQEGMYLGHDQPWTKDLQNFSIERWTNLDPRLQERITTHRTEVQRALIGQTDKLVVILGFCSISDIEEAITFIDELKKLRNSGLTSNLILLPRIYGEKPRTTVLDTFGNPNFWGYLAHGNNKGPKGFEILNSKFVKEFEELMIYTVENDFGIATEFLNSYSAALLGHLITFGTVGARTVDDTKFINMYNYFMNYLGIAGGWKNDMKGNLYNLNQTLETRGGVGILRGGENGPNYEMKFWENILKKPPIIDLSHKNSDKDPEQALQNMQYFIDMLIEGKYPGKGIMVEVDYGNSETDDGILVNEAFNKIININKGYKQYLNKKAA